MYSIQLLFYSGKGKPCIATKETLTNCMVVDFGTKSMVFHDFHENNPRYYYPNADTNICRGE